MVDEAERHGFDMWRLAGATWQAAVEVLAALATGGPTALASHISTLTTFLDGLRKIDVNIYTTVFDGILGRLMIAAGQPDAARERLDIGLTLARETGMCFYDAELLRLRAETQVDPDVREAEISAALQLARSQTATLFELRTALDDFELRGEVAADTVAAAANRIPANSACPELERARAALSQ
jgi:hypothetical protein